MNYKISVIVPVYNAGDYFNHCVDSILNQTYKRIELILVDDGSTDDSGARCDEFAKSDNRIKVIHKANGGAASARNAGLDAATGDYIGFVDADDWIDSDMYEIMLSEIIEYGADAARCGIVRELDNGQTEEWGTGNTNIIVADKTQLQKDVAEGFGILPVSPCNKLFSRKCIGDIRFDTRFKFAEDTLFNFMVAKNINSIVYHDVDRYHYNDNSASITNKHISENNFDEHRVMDIIINMSEEDILPYAIKGDVLKSFRTLRQIIESGKYKDRFNSIRKRIVKYKSDIIRLPIYSKRTKKRTLLLYFCPKLYILILKIYKK